MQAVGAGNPSGCVAALDCRLVGIDAARVARPEAGHSKVRTGHNLLAAGQVADAQKWYLKFCLALSIGAGAVRLNDGG